ncbi:hypothetical protein UFOVP826_36 [uncultured Caudovirales phage]|uniref:Uncharacterized protein n=1 Tax=uncultured Caudovirales phage TaxID=2100421 RepID=A0A6J5NXN9_9CAUD|nr:hypothetical protein UFOVP826_36 [uncultured Caudovirales phage]
MRNRFYWHGEGKQGGPLSSIDEVRKTLVETERRGSFRAIRMLNDTPVSVEDVRIE